MSYFGPETQIFYPLRNLSSELQMHFALEQRLLQILDADGPLTRADLTATIDLQAQIRTLGYPSALVRADDLLEARQLYAITTETPREQLDQEITKLTAYLQSKPILNAWELRLLLALREIRFSAGS